MQCIICHSEDIVSKVVQAEIKIDDDIMRVPVQVLLCLSCGERYYSRKVVRYLEEIERKLQTGEIPLKQAGRVMEYA